MIMIHTLRENLLDSKCHRNFDVTKDEHPVTWLIASLRPELYEPIVEWLEDLLGESILKPTDVTMPETSSQYLKTVFHFELGNILTTEFLLTQEGTRVSNLNLPLTAFAVRVPSDGLPILADWTSHAMSIWTSGYEGWREGLEFKPLLPNLGGKQAESL